MASHADIDQIKATMRTYFIESAGIEEAALADGSVMIESLGIDSLSIVELLWVVEEQYGLQVKDLKALKGITVDGLASYFLELLSANDMAVATGTA